MHKIKCLSSNHVPINIEIKVSNIDIDALYQLACHLGGHASVRSQEERDPMVLT